MGGGGARANERRDFYGSRRQIYDFCMLRNILIRALSPRTGSVINLLFFFVRFNRLESETNRVFSTYGGLKNARGPPGNF